MDALVRDALAAGTSIESATATLSQARALPDSASAALTPSMGDSGSAQRSRRGPTFKAGVDANCEWDLFGGQHANVTARAADVEVARATLDDAQVSIAAEVRLAYVQSRATQQRLALAQANPASQRETLQVVQWRLQEGRSSSREVEQARASALQSESQLQQFATSIAQSSHVLAALTGPPPAGLPDRLAIAAPILLPESLPATGMPADTLRQRRVDQHRRPDGRALTVRPGDQHCIVRVFGRDRGGLRPILRRGARPAWTRSRR